MKAHRNMRSHFSIISQALLVLCCIALLAPRPAEAQDRTVVIDENGRVNAPPAMAIMANSATLVARDVLKENGCDIDDCSKFEVRETQDQFSGDARTLTGSLSFQIQAGAPANSINVAPDGNIGIGTDTPRGRLHVVARPGEEGAADIFLLDNNGNLEIGGLLTEASSVLLKEHFVAIDGQEVLDRLARLPITTWNYKTDAPSIRHMGPMAQDFYAAFGLGADDRHLAPLDVNGVALAGVQALSQQVQALEQQNAELLQRLQALEALVQRDK
ncbi:MAG: tail fiber domain-containing protein [Rhodothermales bacterium]